jgi:lipoate-protein ligase A
MSWRLLETPPAHGAWNMAVDEAVLSAVAAGDAPSTLRLYTWSPGCISIGRFQRAGDLTEDARAEPGVSWVRRPTGGRALYHGPELTYSLVAPLGDEHVSGAVLQSCGKIAQALLAGLELLGVRAELAGCGDPARMRANPSCFDSASAGEILHEGRKLAGSAQLRHGSVLLQHGSILLGSPAREFFAGLRFDTEEERQRARESGEARLTTLEKALGRAPDPAEVRDALVRGFESCWGIALSSGECGEGELGRARELEVSKYWSLDWSYRKS